MITAAFIGSPNSGKTTLFNKLTGSTQRVGNWPGVTVERKQGYIRGTTGDRILAVDLPGVYSLSPYSPEEVVSRDYLIGTIEDRPDVAVSIVDASNLERALYLLMQVSDTDIPMVVILNMVDIAEKAGRCINAKKLSEVLGCEVVETVALKNKGVSAVGDAIERAFGSGKTPNVLSFPPQVEEYVERIARIVAPEVREGLERFVAVRAIEHDPLIINSLEKTTMEKVLSEVKELETAMDSDGVQIASAARYDTAREIAEKCTVVAAGKDDGRKSITERADDILLNRWAAIPIFVAIMFLMYYFSVQTVGAWGTEFISDRIVNEWAREGMRRILEDYEVAAPLIGLICDGMIAGAGAVIGYLPQIMCLFLCLALLEEVGYMSRIAYMLDRLFCRFGLSGQTVIPMVIGTGCGVPGILCARTISDRRTRTSTVMTTTMMPCSAKLPIITVIISAFFGGSALIATSMYILGIVIILMSGIILSKLKGVTGEPAPFMMELPRYHCPAARNICTCVLERSWSFVKNAGTFVLLATVIVWLLSSYDTSFHFLESGKQNESILAALGKSISWVFAPNGFGHHWEMSVGVITGLLGKENLLSTLTILIPGAIGDEHGFISPDSLRAFCTAEEGMAFLLFNLFCAPCFASIGAMKRELGTWKKTGFALLYQCTVAYIVSMVYYNIATAVNGDVHMPGLIASFVLIAVTAYLLIAKDPVGAVRRRAEKLRKEAGPR